MWCICSQLTAYGNEFCSLHGVSPATVMALVFAANRQVRLIQLRMPLTRHSRLGFGGICPAKLFYGHGCILNPALRISENCVATSDSGVSLPCGDNGISTLPRYDRNQCPEKLQMCSASFWQTQWSTQAHS